MTQHFALKRKQFVQSSLGNVRRSDTAVLQLQGKRTKVISDELQFLSFNKYSGILNTRPVVECLVLSKLRQILGIGIAFRLKFAASSIIRV